MRILHVSQPTSAGVAAVVEQAARFQAGQGHEVSVACPEGELSELVAAIGVPWHRWDATREPGPSVLGETVRLRRIVRDVRPDVVHLHSSKAGLAGRLASGLDAQVVFQPHSWSFEAVGGMIARASVRWERWAQRRTDATVWCSWDEQDRGRRAGVQALGAVALNGVDLTAFAPVPDDRRRAMRAGLDLPADAPVAVIVGRLATQKGQDVAIAAWPRVREDFPDARLLLVGSGPAEDELRELAGPGVHLLGERPPFAAYGAADVAVLPSRWEGMSLALLEGLACGLPTVATEVSGAREAMLAGADPAAGALVPADDIDALAEAVVARFRDPALRAAEGRAARTRAEQFAPEPAMRTIVDTYRMVAPRKPLDDVVDLRAGTRAAP